MIKIICNKCKEEINPVDEEHNLECYYTVISHLKSPNEYEEPTSVTLHFCESCFFGGQKRATVYAEEIKSDRYKKQLKEYINYLLRDREETQNDNKK